MDNDLAHDLARAKELLAKGKTCPYYTPDHNTECTHCDEWADEHGVLEADEQWAVYRLLATFVPELEQFLGLFSDYEEPCESFAQAEAIWNDRKTREQLAATVRTTTRAEIARLRARITELETQREMWQRRVKP